MKYKIRKFQNPSGTLQYLTDLNAEVQKKNNSPEERVRRALNLKKNQNQEEEYTTPGFRTDRNGIVSVDYENQGDYVPSATSIALTDGATKLLHGVQTFGGSVVGDVVKEFSPEAANWLDKNTFGAITTTPEEKLQRNRSGRDVWQHRLTDAANALITPLAVITGGKVLGDVGRKVLQSKPAQRVLSGRLNFTPKDSRFLVNQEGFRAPKVTETLKDQEEWFVGLMKKHNPNATAVNEANLRSHVPEYNQIINRAKKAGTYMKNSDGSVFQGDPREWTMLQSKNAQWLDKRPWYTGVPGKAIKEGSDAGKLMSENFNKFTGDVWASNNEHYANVFAQKNLSDSRGKVFKIHSPKGASTYKVDNGPQPWNNMPIDRNTHKLSSDAVIEMRGFRGMTGTKPEQKPIYTSKNWLNEKDLSKKLNPGNSEYGVSTDDIFAHAKKNGYERTRMNNIMDGIGFFKNSAGEWDYYDPFIDINVIHSKTPRKSVLGNDGTFSKIDPNIFGSILGAIGLGANKINE